MKKIFRYIMSATLVVTGMMQFASCNDANDWTVDPSVTKQRPPTSLKVELADSASLDINVTIGTLANAVSYELQVSESPLSSVEANDAATVTSDVWIFDGIKVSDFQGGKYVLKRDNGKFTIMQNTTYYFRVRAVGEDGTKSNWYTNGLLYNGSDGDEKIAQILLENSYNNNSNLNSTSSLTTPSLMWVDDNEIDPDALTISWHETDYTTVATIRNETLGTEVSASSAIQNPDYTKVKVWYYKWDGLEVNKSYTFSLLDAAGNVISTLTKSTEPAPNMALAHSILKWEMNDVIGAKGESKVVYDPDNYFSITFNEESAANAGYTNTGKYYCQTPDKKVYTSPYRVQVKNRNTLEVKIPESGRLYLYANGTPTTYEVSKCIGKGDDGTDQWEVIKKVTVKKDDKTPIEDEGGSTRSCFKFTKLKLNGAVDGRYKIAPTESKSCYYYGFVFVPDDPNAEQE